MTSPPLLLLLRRLGHYHRGLLLDEWCNYVFPVSSPRAVHCAARHGGLKLDCTSEALQEVANFAFRVNEGMENIGAPRLHTIIERVLDEISFEAPDVKEKNLTSRCR